MTSNNICSTRLLEEELQRLDSLYNREYSEDVEKSMYDYSKHPKQVEFLLPRNTELVAYDIKGNNVYCTLKYI